MVCGVTAVFPILYALVRLQSKVMPGRSPGDRPKTQVPGSRSIALFALGMGLVIFFVRIWAPFGWWWEPLHLEPAHLPQYFALFTVGSIAFRNNWFACISTTKARAWGWVALALVPLALSLSGVRLNLSLKFVFVTPLAVILCFLAGYFVRRLPVFKRIL